MSASFARVISAQPKYLDSEPITIEVDISRGLHSFSIVGLADKAVDESRDRVSSALNFLNLPSPKHQNEKTVVALAPAHHKKQGVYFDLAIAIGYLIAKKRLEPIPESTLIIGELALNGEVRPVAGIVSIALLALKNGITTIFVPQANAKEASLIKGIEVIGVSSLQDLVNHLDKSTSYQLEPLKTELNIVADSPQPKVCFSDIKGQAQAKRALMISASGGHNVLMYGPPGTGKSMLAQAFAGILPPLTEEESLVVTKIKSLTNNQINSLTLERPFQSPHHTSSYTAIIGGGTNIEPGIITKAHLGVLFLDEFPEFDRRVLEGLRQPLEDRVVNIARASGQVSFPASFILVTAMNPPDPNASVADIRRLEKKLSGPILDRIDLWTPVEHIDYDTLTNNKDSLETSADIKLKVMSARDRQLQRKKALGIEWPETNSHLSAKQINQMKLSVEIKDTLNKYAKTLKLSPRSYHRVLKVARTIADLEDKDHLDMDCILEALAYRQKKSAVTTPYQI